MKLAMPQEIEVWYILPAIRREFVTSLTHDHGLSQKEAAALLCLTESAVSQYLKQKRGTEVQFSQTVRDEINASTSKILKHKTPAIQEMVRISRLPEVKKVLCELHKKEQKGLSNCQACFDETVTLL